MRRPVSSRALLLGLAGALIAAALPVGGALALFTDTFANGSNTPPNDTLDPPTGLTASGGSCVSLTWAATSDTYATGHRILRSAVAGGPYSQIADVTPRTTTTYIDGPLLTDTYYYVSRAY